MENSLIPHSKISFKDFLLVFFPILLVCGVVWQFQLEEKLKLPFLSPLIAGGFFIHAFLPIKFRLPFLFILNIIALFVLFTTWQALALLGICLTIFGFLQIPLAPKIRMGSLVAMAAGLLYVRTSIPNWTLLQSILPFVGAVFMFRTILYVYEAKYEKEKVPFWKRLAYFFLLPNWIFLIFPIVDYKTFHRNYFSRPAIEIYKKGLRWMAIGAFHLFLYRILYYYFMPSPLNMGNVFDLSQYLIVGYGLSLRFSGMFHFSVGVICLFGFDLPKVFSNHFLASGFNDLWRRVNIYWKDFMIKVFYYPVYFRYKKAGTRKALVIALAITFIITWFFHAYQWQWLSGTFLLTVPDMLFWGIFGLMMIGSSLYQQHRKRKRISTASFSLQRASIYALQVMAMFSLMCILWSLWTSAQMKDWISLFTIISTPSLSEVFVLVLACMLVFSFGILLQYLDFLLKSKKIQYAQKPFMLALFGIFGIMVWFSTSAGQNIFQKFFSIDTKPILTTQLNEYDKSQQFKGYYETLVLGNNVTSQIWDLNVQKKQEGKNWEPLARTRILKRNRENLLVELYPNMEVTFKSAQVISNSHGIRDREYPLTKPKDHLRIALLGVSQDFGSGVSNEETYENLLEDKLNAWGGLGKVEILNFALPGNIPPLFIDQLNYKVRDFKPDVLLVANHAFGKRNLANKLFSSFKHPSRITGTFLDSVRKEIAFSEEDSEFTFYQKLAPYNREIYRWSYQGVKNICETDSMLAVQVFFPRITGVANKASSQMIDSMTLAMGYHNIYLHGIFDDYSLEELQLAPWDAHFNSFAHSLVSEKLFEIISNEGDLFQLLIQAKK